MKNKLNQPENETPEEKAKRLGVNLIPETQPWPIPTGHNPIVAVCGKCGREIKEVDFYACGSDNCPTQSKVMM